MALNSCQAAEPSALRLYVLDCGYMDMAGWEDFETFFGVPLTAVEKPAQANPCFLVVNNGNTLLWDAGLSDATPSEPFITEFGVMFSMPTKLQDQLELIEIPPQSIDYFAISHLHFDHIGNWAYFIHTDTFLQEAELQAALMSGNENIGYVEDTVREIAKFEDLILLDGDHDVFGDGLVTILSTPGHTAGHQALLVKLKNYGPIILSGDTVHFSEELTHEVSPVFNDSNQESIASLARLIALKTSLKGHLWIQHDPMQHQNRKLSPEFYD